MLAQTLVVSECMPGGAHTGLRALRLLEERSICLLASPTSVEKLVPDPADSRSMARSASACRHTQLSQIRQLHVRSTMPEG